MANYMISSLNAAKKDPDNEALRREGLNVGLNRDLEFEPLLRSTEDIHASWLFIPNILSQKLLKSLCLSLSSHPINSNGGWYNFSGYLNFNWKSLEVISNINILDKDKTEICLTTFAQCRSSTLKGVIKTLKELMRYDAITSAQNDIECLVRFIKSARAKELWDQESLHLFHYENDEDSGVFISQSGGLENLDTIIRPKIWKTLFRSLPISLREFEDMYIELAEPEGSYNSPTIEIIAERLQKAVPGSIPWEQQHFDSKRNKIIFLTFARDGLPAAKRIAALLNSVTEMRKEKYGVLLLEENKRVLSENQELMIVTLFNMMDYIMPILTEGYFKAIKNMRVNPEMNDALFNLDERYAPLIYSLMLSEFCENGCRNRRFRCIIPNEANKSKIDQRLKGQIVLKAWSVESRIESLIETFC